MPNKQAAMKFLRQTKTRTARNEVVRENLEFLKRTLRKAIDKKDAKTAEATMVTLTKHLDKAVQKGVVKLNTGSRIKSRTIKAIRAIAGK